MRLPLQYLFALVSLAAFLSPGDLSARTRTDGVAGLAARSRHTAIVRCLEAVSSQPVAGGMIFTTYRLQRVETVAGTELPGEISVRVAGGDAGNFRVAVPHAPRFAAGQTYLVFLRTASRSPVLLVTGADQGVFDARRDDATKQWTIALPRQASTAKTATGAPAPRVVRNWVPLGEFKARLSGRGEE